MSGQVPAGHLPALVPTDDDHQQASIIIATTILLFTALLFVGARLWVRCNPDEEQRKGTGPRGSLLGGDDLLIVTSTAFYILHAALILGASSNGLGNTILSIPLDLYGKIEKLYYAANVFYVLSLGCSKASVSYLLVRINSERAPLVTASLKGVLYLTAAWTVAMMFVFIFMCGTTLPWAFLGHKCPDWYLNWEIFSISGCCFEVMNTAIAVWSVWDLQTKLYTKAVVVSLFALRLLLVPIVAVGLRAFHVPDLETDPTLHTTLVIILSELGLSYSICSATFPAFRRLTSDIRTDFGGFGINTSTHASHSASKGYMRSGGGTESDEFPKPAFASAQPRIETPDLRGGMRSSGIGYSVQVRNGDTSSLVSNGISDDARSEDRIIRARTEITVLRDE